MDTQQQSDLIVRNTVQSNTMTASLTGDTDVTHLLNVFPEELWRLILANVQDANDYLRLCGISPFFKTLLEGQRVPVLLTAVVQILLRRQERWEWEPDHWNPELAEKDPRVHLWHLDRCRQVSRHWKTGIERALQNLPYHHQFSQELEKMDYQFYPQVFQNYSIWFDCLNNLNAFEWWFHESHLVSGANPFTTRALEIRIPFGKPELPEFINKLLDVLRKCGKHVWYLTIRGDMGSSYWPTAKQFAHFLKNVLEQVPNLKALRYAIWNPFRFCDPLDCQFPPLKKLVYFDQVGLPFGIVNAHLQSAKPSQVGATFHKETFSDDEKLFREFCQLNIPASKLRIEFCGAKMYWDGIFTKLETYFGEELTTLFITLPRTGLFAKSKQLRLPNLKQLNLELEIAVPLDFLLGMTKTLQSFTLKVKIPLSYHELKCVQSQERNLKIYSAAQTDKLYLSNIWQMFPHLDQLAISGLRERERSPMECTREEWKFKYPKYLKYSTLNFIS